MRRLLLFATTLLAASGCGGDGGDRLAEALDSVSAGPESQERFAWTDMAALREHADLPDPDEELDTNAPATRRWFPALGTGSSQLLAVRVSFGAPVGVRGADQTINIGPKGTGAGRLDGVDVDANRDELRAAGAEDVRVGERDALRPPLDDIEGVPSIPDTFGIPDFLVVADGEQVAFAGSEADLLEVLGDDGEALGDLPAHAAGVDCLGDVLAAQLLTGAGTTTDAAELVAFGVRGNGGDGPTEVLCAVGDEAQATAAADALRANLTLEATAEFNGGLLSDIATGVEVDTGSTDDRHWARAVLTPVEGQPLEIFAESLEFGDIDRWLGD